MKSLLDVFLDNPIIIKHVRSRLRPSQFLPTAFVVFCFCVAILWTGVSLGAGSALASGFTLSLLLGLGSLILALGGASQVTTSVGQAKESGILDFHRVSPLPASTVAIGFFLGAPIREYALFAITIPFALYAAASSSTGLVEYGSILASQLLSSWVLHALSLLVALISKRPRATGQGILVLLVIGFFSTRGLFGWATSVLGSTDEPGKLNFFGFFLPWIAFLALYEGTALFFLLIASTRKMRAERAHAYSKPLALGFMGSAVTLALGAFWSLPTGNGYVVPSCIYLFTIVGLILATTVTPDLGEYLKGIRRALRSDHRRAPIFSDAASNQFVMYGLAGLTAMGSTIAWEAIEGMPEGGRYAYSQAVALGTFVVAYYGFGLQYFLLRFGKRGASYFGLFLFLVWLLPLMVALAAGISMSSASTTIQSILAVSPLAGIMLSITGGIEGASVDSVRFAAVLPAVSLAFLFHFMLTALQRKLDREIRSLDVTGKPKFIPLAELAPR